MRYGWCIHRGFILAIYISVTSIFSGGSRNTIGGLAIRAINNIDRTKVTYLQQTAFIMTLERLSVPQKMNSPFQCPAFNMAYIEELERLQINFDSADRSSHKILCALCGDELMGYVDLHNLSHSKGGLPPGPYLSDLAVKRSCRRQGIGGALLKKCEEICLEEWDESYLHLMCDTKNTGALKLYFATGYEPVALDRIVGSDNYDLEMEAISYESFCYSYCALNRGDGIDSKENVSEIQLLETPDSIFGLLWQSYERVTMRREF